MGGQDHLNGVGGPPGYRQVVGSKAAYRGVLTDVHAGTDKALTVDKVLEGEGQVGGLLQGLFWAFERLYKPFA